ncbi:hypothetical protein GCM10011575_38560 [Microlunatus endophyticus]|uniref:Uncharacterized protein n=1 Tax=Microlunatus endophyticus TaxID=1716077 RepID=A0A917SG36_9ACTN|nr:hypothetical protein [Microlunatus endophyticus]GGL76698.1 hypothetical protein GCM10011575_38560 [Microlunatus endophyticus]
MSARIGLRIAAGPGILGFLCAGGAGLINASADPVKPLVFVGCTGKIVNVFGPGNQSTAQCTDQKGYTQIRAIAECKSHNFAYGAWVADNWSLSQTNTCYTGVMGSWGSGYYYQAR